MVLARDRDPQSDPVAHVAVDPQRLKDEAEDFPLTLTRRGVIEASFTLSGFNQFNPLTATIHPGVRTYPAIGGYSNGGTPGDGVLFPGDYELATYITQSTLVPACWGTTVETELFVETEAGA